MKHGFLGARRANHSIMRMIATVTKPSSEFAVHSVTPIDEIPCGETPVTSNATNLDLEMFSKFVHICHFCKSCEYLLVGRLMSDGWLASMAELFSKIPKNCILL